MIQPAIAFAQAVKKTGPAITAKEDELGAIRRGATIREKMRAQYGGASRLGDLVTVQRVVDGILTLGEIEFPQKLNEYLDIQQPRGRFTSREPGDNFDAGFDGQQSWVVKPSSGDPLPRLRPEIFLRGWIVNPHVLLANEVCEVLFSRQETIEGKSFFVVLVKDPLKNDLLADMWVDTTSFLVRRIVTKEKGVTRGTIDFDDYRMVEGIPFAFRVTSSQGNVVNRQALLRVIINPKLRADFYLEPVQ